MIKVSLFLLLLPKSVTFKSFHHDQRYTYWEEVESDGNGGWIRIKKHEDLGTGWWYPGEPEKGSHER